MTWVLTELPRRRGPVTYTEVSSTVIVADRKVFVADSLDDLNGDGREELVLGSWPGEFAVFLSPLPAGVIDYLHADLLVTPFQSGAFGEFMAVGDLDLDGVEDIAAGDPYAVSVGPSTWGEAWVISGQRITDELGL